MFGIWNRKPARPKEMRMTLIADPAAVRARYGKSWALATDPQKANRDADRFDGGGRYRKRRRMRRGGLSRMYRRYRGKGLYGGTGGFWSDLWDKTRGHLGASFKQVAPEWMGNALTAAEGFGKAQGWGPYDTGGGPTTVNNEIVDGGEGLNVPQFASGGGEMGTITISHREYVADVFGPDSAGVFQNITYGLNPALPDTFPWLSQVAANYEEYTIKQLIFTFRTTVTDFVASNGQVGTVLMATQYNANDSPFQSKQDMMEYAGAVSAKVSQQIHAGVECDPAQLSGAPGKYTRSGPAPPGEDLKTYDVGTLNIATSNTPAQFNNQAIGELWVSYTVELRKPKFFVTRAQQLLTDVFIADSAATGGTALGSIDWGVGQQNRIGGLLATTLPTNNSDPNNPIAYPAGANTLYYVFPATFAGDVEITLGASTPAPPASPNQLCYINTTAPTTGAPGILPINDIWSNIGTGGYWTNNIQSDSTTGASRTNHIYHFRITTPTTAQQAVDNVLMITGAEPLSTMYLRISMYNTGLNYAKSSKPIMANPSTDEVIQFPAQTGQVP